MVGTSGRCFTPAVFESSWFYSSLFLHAIFLPSDSHVLVLKSLYIATPDSLRIPSKQKNVIIVRICFPEGCEKNVRVIRRSGIKKKINVYNNYYRIRRRRPRRASAGNYPPPHPGKSFARRQILASLGSV